MELESENNCSYINNSFDNYTTLHNDTKIDLQCHSNDADDAIIYTSPEYHIYSPDKHATTLEKPTDNVRECNQNTHQVNNEYFDVEHHNIYNALLNEMEGKSEYMENYSEEGEHETMQLYSESTVSEVQVLNIENELCRSQRANLSARLSCSKNNVVKSNTSFDDDNSACDGNNDVTNTPSWVTTDTTSSRSKNDEPNNSSLKKLLASNDKYAQVQNQKEEQLNEENDKLNEECNVFAENEVNEKRSVLNEENVSNVKTNELESADTEREYLHQKEVVTSPTDQCDIIENKSSNNDENGKTVNNFSSSGNVDNTVDTCSIEHKDASVWCATNWNGYNKLECNYAQYVCTLCKMHQLYSKVKQAKSALSESIKANCKRKSNEELYLSEKAADHYFAPITNTTALSTQMSEDIRCLKSKQYWDYKYSSNVSLQYDNHAVCVADATDALLEIRRRYPEHVVCSLLTRLELPRYAVSAPFCLSVHAAEITYRVQFIQVASDVNREHQLEEDDNASTKYCHVNDHNDLGRFAVGLVPFANVEKMCKAAKDNASTSCNSTWHQHAPYRLLSEITNSALLFCSNGNLVLPESEKCKRTPVGHKSNTIKMSCTSTFSVDDTVECYLNFNHKSMEMKVNGVQVISFCEKNWSTLSEANVSSNKVNASVITTQLVLHKLLCRPLVIIAMFSQDGDGAIFKALH